MWLVRKNKWTQNKKTTTTTTKKRQARYEVDKVIFCCTNNLAKVIYASKQN